MDDPDINDFKKDPLGALLGMVYILKFGVPTHPQSMEELEAFNQSDYRIGHTVIGDLEVSTVFLAYPSPAFMNGSIIKMFFETAIFGASDGVRIVARYMSLPDAESGHKAITEQLRTLQTQSLDYTRDYLDRLSANIPRG